MFHIVRKAWNSNTKMLKWQNKNIVIQYSSREFDINVLTFFVQKTSNCQSVNILWVKKMLLAPPGSYFAIKKYKKKNIRWLHKIMKEIFCTKIKILLARSLFIKTKSEDQGINLVCPYCYLTADILTKVLQKCFDVFFHYLLAWQLKG